MRLALLVGLSAAGLAAPSFAVDGDDVVDSAIVAHHLAVRRAPPHPKLPAPSQALALKPSAVIKFSMTLPRESAEAARTSPAGSISSATVQAQTRPADTPPIPVANTSAPVVVTPASEPPVTSTCACAIL